MNISEEINKRFLLQNEYLGDDKPVNNLEPHVSVIISTYQQVDYIKACLDGILLQQTEFVFEIIIGEDDSTDGTREICIEYAEKYPDKIRLFLRERTLSHLLDNNGLLVKRLNGIFGFSLLSARGKYIAVCEGDDYWIDSNKLQKQIDILENSPSIGLVYSQARVFLQDKKRFKKKCFGFSVPKKGVMFYNCVPTVTVVCRRSLMLKYRSETIEYSKMWKMGDYPMWIWFDLNSNLYFLNEKTAVYRYSANSLSSRSNGEERLIFLENSFKISDFFAKKTLKKDEYNDFLLVKYLGLYNASIKANTNHHSIYLNKFNSINRPLYIKAYLFLFETLGFRRIVSLFLSFS
tara:strand:+ start:5034 stop:6077 length:1044 start_codon:yes stop_codon:yes gene_type:complete